MKARWFVCCLLVYCLAGLLINRSYAEEPTQQSCSAVDTSSDGSQTAGRCTVVSDPGAVPAEHQSTGTSDPPEALESPSETASPAAAATDDKTVDSTAAGRGADEVRAALTELRALLSEAKRSVHELSSAIRRHEGLLVQLDGHGNGQQPPHSSHDHPHGRHTADSPGPPQLDDALQGGMALYKLAVQAGAVAGIEGDGAEHHTTGRAVLQDDSGTVGPGGSVTAYGSGRPIRRTVARAGRSWLDGFQLLAAVRADAEVSVVHAFNERMVPASASTWSLPRYIAMGDAAGKVYLFNARGDLLREYSTGTTSRITAMASYSLRRNESVLVTGHEDGQVRTHGVYEIHSRDLDEHTISSIYLEHVLTPGQGVMDRTTGVRLDSEPAPITHMGAFRAGGGAGGKRSAVAWDRAGWLRVQRDDGSLRSSAHTNHTPIAMQINGKLIVGISATHAVVLHTNLLGSARAYECQGLNGSLIIAAAFDPIRVYRAYALTDRGEMLALVVPHESRTSVCKVSRAKALPMLPPGEVTMTSLRGYVVLGHAVGNVVFNVSSVLKAGFTDVLADSNAVLAGLVGANASQLARPIVVVVGHSNLLAVHLGAGLVTFFDSVLPIPKGMEAMQKTNWMQPVFIGLMILIAFFQFYKARGRRHDSYASRSRFRGGAGGMPEGLMAGRGRMGMFGGQDPREGATSSEDMYYEALNKIQKNYHDAMPSRAARRAARMSPITTLQEEDEGEYEDLRTG